MYIFSERETECCGVYCCLLYIGHGSPDYSCHTLCQWLLLLILFPLICLFFFLVLLPFQWTPVTSFCPFFNVVLFTSPSLSLLHCKADILHNRWRFLVDITGLCFLSSGFLWEGWDANVSTLYNDGQLCIYCLFIVDLYMKRNEYIIYIYIYT